MKTFCHSRVPLLTIHMDSFSCNTSETRNRNPLLIFLLSLHVLFAYCLPVGTLQAIASVGFANLKDDYRPTTVRYSSKSLDMIVHTNVCCVALECYSFGPPSAGRFRFQEESDVLVDRVFYSTYNYSKGSIGFSSGNEIVPSTIKKSIHGRIRRIQDLGGNKLRYCQNKGTYRPGLHVLFSDGNLHNLNHLSRDWSLVASLVYHDIRVSGIILHRHQLPKASKAMLDMVVSFLGIKQEDIFWMDKYSQKRYAAIVEKASRDPATPFAMEKFRKYIYQNCSVNPNADTIFVLGRPGRRRFTDEGVRGLLDRLQTIQSAKVRYVEFDGISLCGQVQVMAKAIAFIAVHGQIVGNMPFLQTNAPFVELLLGEGDLKTRDLTCKGHGMTARSFGVSYVALAVLDSVGGSSCARRDQWMYNSTCLSHLSPEANNIVFCTVNTLHECTLQSVPFCSCKALEKCQSSLLLHKLCNK